MLFFAINGHQNVDSDDSLIDKLSHFGVFFAQTEKLLQRIEHNTH